MLITDLLGSSFLGLFRKIKLTLIIYCYLLQATRAA